MQINLLFLQWKINLVSLLFETVQSILLEYQALWSMALAISSNGSDILYVEQNLRLKSKVRVAPGSKEEVIDKQQIEVKLWFALKVRTARSSYMLFLAFVLLGCRIHLFYIYIHLYFIAWCDKRFHFLIALLQSLVQVRAGRELLPWLRVIRICISSFIVQHHKHYTTFAFWKQLHQVG